jgi:hypothetical protein
MKESDKNTRIFSINMGLRRIMTLLARLGCASSSANGCGAPKASPKKQEKRNRYISFIYFSLFNSNYIKSFPIKIHLDSQKNFYTIFFRYKLLKKRRRK